MSDLPSRAPCGYVEFSDDGTIRSVNDTLAVWVGRAPNELIGEKFESILTTANRIFYQTHFFPLLTLHGSAEEIFLSLRPKSGESIPVIVSAERSVKKGRVATTRCVLLRVPQRRKYEDEILRAKAEAEDALRSNAELSKAKTELEQRTRELEKLLVEQRSKTAELTRVTEILSHDLKEPVRKIGLFTDLIGTHSPPSDLEAQQALRKIQQQVSTVEQMVAAIRRFTQANNSAGPEHIELTELIQSCAAAVRARTGVEDWRAECDHLPAVSGHRAPLTLMFTHLFENAVKFRDPHRSLKTSVSGQIVQQNIYQATKERYTYADFVQIRLEDNGRGFDPKYKDYVFRLMKKVDLDSAGFGIGLAICRKVAEAHFGSISAEPVPGVGTTFTVTLPLEI